MKCALLHDAPEAWMSLHLVGFVWALKGLGAPKGLNGLDASAPKYAKRHA